MKKHRVGKWFFRRGQYVLLRRMFGKFIVKSIHVDESHTIIVNHSNFYDSLVLFELQQKKLLTENAYALMTRQGIEKFPLFKSIGVLPLSTPMKLSEYKDIMQTMKTSNIVVFPQGEEQHLERRPVQIEAGTATLLEKNPQHGLLFVTLYYSFGSGIRAEIACRMHYTYANERPKVNLHAFIEETMEQQLDKLREDVVQQNVDGYRSLW